MEANSALGIQHEIQLQKYEFICKGSVSFLKVCPFWRHKLPLPTQMLSQLVKIESDLWDK